MKSTIIKISFICLLLGLMGAGCKNEHEIEQQNVNIILHDKPLSVIQEYITGNWKLQYQIGGIAGIKYVNKYNSYINLTPDHIIMGNDLHGVVIDTSIVWKRDLIGNEYTYLMGYPDPGWPTPTYFIVNQIKNDTLIIADYNVSDEFSYYYTKH